MNTYVSDDIVALATPPGLGALAIVRFSGQSLSSIYKSFTKNSPKNRYAALCKIYHPKTDLFLDQSIITFFRSPNSFTGEDVFEITCHGGNVVAKSIINAALDIGLRTARPGEFSLRAFLNGKIDLLQAEAISSIISSTNITSTNINLNHLDGSVSNHIKKIKNNAINLLSVIENELNFSENEINSISINDIKTKINLIKSNINSILKASLYGKNLFSGFRIAIIGKPNAGKSTLFNAILGSNRVIVSNRPGTTRDSVEAWFNLEGVSICLIDTAGISDTKDDLDQLGINKTFSEINNADLYIVLDEKNPQSFLKENNIKLINNKCLFVKSKQDSQKDCRLIKNNINLSVKNQLGIKELLTYISTIISNDIKINLNNSNLMINERQRILLKSSYLLISDAHSQLISGEGIDIVASSLHGFVDNLRDVIGEIPTTNVLNNIFKTFCVGK